MWKNFFQHIDIDPVNVHILDGNAEDLQKECDSFETKIAEAGGVDLFIGGKNGCVRLVIYSVHALGPQIP